MKAGQLAHNRSPIGAEMLHKGKLMRKVREGGPRNNQWDYVHRLNWEAVNGPVPAGHRLVCIGDRANPAADNWKALPNSAAISMHKKFPGGAHAAPAELAETIVNTALVEHAIRSRSDSRLLSLPSTRSEARLVGARWYYTGKPCPKGHLAKRFTKSTNCYGCHNGPVATRNDRQTGEPRS